MALEINQALTKNNKRMHSFVVGTNYIWSAATSLIEYSVIRIYKQFSQECTACFYVSPDTWIYVCNNSTSNLNIWLKWDDGTGTTNTSTNWFQFTLGAKYYRLLYVGKDRYDACYALSLYTINPTTKDFNIDFGNYIILTKRS